MTLKPKEHNRKAKLHGAWKKILEGYIHLDSLQGIGHGDTSSNHGLIAFHIALKPLGKVWIQLFSLQQ